MIITNDMYTQFRSSMMEGEDLLVKQHHMQVHDYEYDKWLLDKKLAQINDYRNAMERVKKYVSPANHGYYNTLSFQWSQCGEVQNKLTEAFNKLEEIEEASGVLYNIDEIDRHLDYFQQYNIIVSDYTKRFRNTYQYIISRDGIDAWQKKASKLVKDGMVTEKRDLISYSEADIDKVLNKGINLFSDIQTKKDAANLHRALFAAKDQLPALERLVGIFDYYNSRRLPFRWRDVLQKELAVLEADVKKLQDSISVKKNNLEPFMQQKIRECINRLTSKFAVEQWNDVAKKWKDSCHMVSDSLKNYESSHEMHENYVYGWQNYSIGRELTNTYVGQYYRKLCELYHELLILDKSSVMMRVPASMSLDQSKWNFVLELSKDDGANRKAVEEWSSFFIASTFVNIPVGKVELHFIDPGNTGIFSVYRDIGKGDDYGNLSQKCHYFSSEEQITAHLVSVSEEISYIINQILKGGESTLYRHNKENTYNMRPYHFLLLNDYPKGLNQKALEQLENIVANGPKCGIFTIIINTKGNAWKLLNNNETVIAKSLLSNVYTVTNGVIKDRLLVPFTYDTYADYDNLISQFALQYNKQLKEEGHLKIHIDDLSGDLQEQGGFKIPIGLNQGGGVEYLSFFDQCQNYLMSGATGSGKSNAMHVMIYTALKYITNLDLYLIDFKHGVEFAPYARLNHPSFKLLAVESVPEFGLAVLRHIKNKIDEIGKLFTQTGVENWWNYYEKTGNALPVTLVMIDEFQHLFDGPQCEECAGIIEYIAKEGRVFNVHIILATQSISTVRGLTDGAKENIFGRLALFHSDAEYKSMFWGDSKLASTLKDDAKGLAVLATAPDNKRIIQIAVKKQFDEVRRELGYDTSEGRFETKLMLSSAQDKPFSIFNAYLYDRYECEDRCGLSFGDTIDLKKSDIRSRMKSGKGARKVMNYQEDCTVYFGDREDENLLLIGSQEDTALNIFTLSLYSLLLRQADLDKKNSIAVFLPEDEDILMDICEEHDDYIHYFTQEDDLTEAFTNDDLEYLLVYGLQNFKSLSFQMAGAGLLRKSDGTAFRKFLEAEEVHAVVWCDRISLIESMYGDGENLYAFLDMFLHKVGMKMDKADSEKYMGSDACTLLSKDSILYRKNNSEKVIRPYNGFDSDYCRRLDDKIKED